MIYKDRFSVKWFQVKGHLLGETSLGCVLPYQPLHTLWLMQGRKHKVIRIFKCMTCSRENSCWYYNAGSLVCTGNKCWSLNMKYNVIIIIYHSICKMCKIFIIYLFIYFLFSRGRPSSETLFFKDDLWTRVLATHVYVNPKQRRKPLLFHDKCSGFFYVHYFNNLVHGTYGLSPHPKCRDRPGRDSISRSNNTRTCSLAMTH